MLGAAVLDEHATVGLRALGPQHSFLLVSLATGLDVHHALGAEQVIEQARNVPVRLLSAKQLTVGDVRETMRSRRPSLGAGQ